jgi:hypothetical protein
MGGIVRKCWSLAAAAGHAGTSATAEVGGDLRSGYDAAPKEPRDFGFNPDAVARIKTWIRARANKD